MENDPTEQPRGTGESSEPKLALQWSHSAEIAIPSSKHERRLAIREVDWARIKRAMKQVQKPLPALGFIYSSLVGVSVSSALTIIPLQFSTGLPPWVVPLYVCLAVFSGLVAWVLHRFEQRFVERQKEDAGAVLEDMAEIERHFIEHAATQDKG